MADKGDHDSSSDDEFTKKALMEATDQELFTNSLFKVNVIKKEHENKETIHGDNKLEKKLKPSLRINPDRADNFHSFGVTQSYKDYVAKKLSEILDREIEIKTVKSKKAHKSSRNNDYKVGIKLLKTSTSILTGDEIEEQKILVKRKRLPLNSETESETLAKCKEAAVDPERILSKIETVSWNERQKGTVFKYKKLANGSLIER